MVALATLFGLGLLAFVVFRAAVHALPLLAGLSIGLTIYRLGEGPLVPTGWAIVAGLVGALLAAGAAWRRLRVQP